MKRARTDLETEIPFVCMRVSKSDVGDWKKLNRVLSWVKETIDDKIIIGSNILTYMYTWIDASYTVHSGMRSHPGGGISMVHGVLYKMRR